MFSWCGTKLDPTRAIAVVMNHQNELYMKRMIIRILQNYANTTDNDIDNEVVDIIERMLLYPRSNIDLRSQSVKRSDILIHFPE